MHFGFEFLFGRNSILSRCVSPFLGLSPLFGLDPQLLLRILQGRGIGFRFFFRFRFRCSDGLGSFSLDPGSHSRFGPELLLNLGSGFGFFPGPLLGLASRLGFRFGLRDHRSSFLIFRLQLFFCVFQGRGVGFRFGLSFCNGLDGFSLDPVAFLRFGPEPLFDLRSGLRFFSGSLLGLTSGRRFGLGLRLSFSRFACVRLNLSLGL